MKAQNKITFYNLLCTIILQGLAFFTIPIFSRVLGTNNFGIVSVYTTWSTLAATILPLQINASLVVARRSYPDEKQNDFQSSVMILALFSYCILSGVVLIIVALILGNHQLNIGMTAAILIYGWGIFCINFLNSKFTYEFKAKHNALLSIFVSLFSISLSLFLIILFPKNINFWGRIIGLACVYGICGINIPLYIIRKSTVMFDLSYAVFALPICIPIIFHSLANLILAQSDRIMLQTIVSNKEVGIYSLTYSFCSVISIIWGALNNSYAPFFHEYIKNKEYKQIRKSTLNYTELFTVICIGFILLSREVYCVFAESEYWEGLSFLPFLVFGHYFIFLYSFSINYEIAIKKTTMIAINTVIAAICNILLNSILIPIFGMLGAVSATVVSYFIQFLIHFIYAKHVNNIFKFPYSILDFFPGIMSMVCAIIMYYILKNFFILRLIICIIIGIYILNQVIKRKSIF